MRLIPPKKRERKPQGGDADTRRWARGLHQQRRGWLTIVLGNALLLLLLVGGPLLRGQERARATARRFAAFSACLLDTQAAKPPGLGEAGDEPVRLASALHADPRTFATHCEDALTELPADDAIFVLPGVKAAEEQVRQAARTLSVELAALEGYEPGERMPVRPLKALSQLREAVRRQYEESGIAELPLHPAIRHDEPPLLAAPASLPLYASPDAVLSIWGSDQVLYAVAMDGTGVSYLESQAGKPYRRARLVRPASLRGFTHVDQALLLLWATAEERCEELVLGCHGKTSGVAIADLPLFDLPTKRFVAAHAAGRTDRSLSFVSGTLSLAAVNARGDVVVQSLLFADGMVQDETLPPLSPSLTWPGTYEDVVLLATRAGAQALTLRKIDDAWSLALVSERTSTALPRVSGEGTPWISGCEHDHRITFVAGTNEQLVLGHAHEDSLRSFAPVVLATRDVVHPSDAVRDHVQPVCGHPGALAIAKGADDALVAISCPKGQPSCRTILLSPRAHRFAALSTPRGVLVAFSESEDAPQIYTTHVGLDSGSATAPIAPAPCWASRRGMCGQPTLARLGRRVVLGAREGTDLAIVESPDDGASWKTPSVL